MISSIPSGNNAVGCGRGGVAAILLTITSTTLGVVFSLDDPFKGATWGFLVGVAVSCCGGLAAICMDRESTSRSEEKMPLSSSRDRLIAHREDGDQIETDVELPVNRNTNSFV